jgi:molybdenum cofactor synthesis domain-containing protein
MRKRNDAQSGPRVTAYHLLQKTELRLGPISLSNTNLNDVAAVIAEMLAMEREAVVVTDLRNGFMTVDILRDMVDATAVVGRQSALLQGLAQLPGVRVTPETSISSSGMLGWIAHDGKRARASLRRTEEMVEEVRRRLRNRAIVFSTGGEVAAGEIEDTNAPMLVRRLQAEGYVVAIGPTLGDDELLIAGKLREAVCDDGYGLVITTGGVGAEDKDCTVEALLALDPDAATPYICQYEVGTGRHRKDGVRIAVGQLADALIVALPGPNDEVRMSLDVLVKGLRGRWPKAVVAEEIARTLRDKLRREMKHCHSDGASQREGFE